MADDTENGLLAIEVDTENGLLAIEVDTENGLLAIEVDTDAYVETTAGDTPSVPRTFQSEADYQAQKAAYHAKTDTGNNLETLYQAVPYLRPSATGTNDAVEDVEGDEAQELESKIVLGKKDVMLLGCAAGQMYYEKRYEEIIQLCDRVESVVVVVVDGKLGESLQRWQGKCRAKLDREKEHGRNGS
ncbi:hypothetical protein DOTSEDRAFT_53582 [Dothistroma septosporum NZE10]|uniref:Uncharacterized protein n=1 Tax=Dothistroma septosporum (strain NZE10 / CBS 128990) TaxID=675120 RepID=N1PQ45_DOTSN|nr:hypothetical protein DOTSEDRAFT_53582 [Dothistroma septosporum NZE10]